MSDGQALSVHDDLKDLDCPASLRQLGPQTIAIEHAGRGRPPRVTLAGTHLKAGKKYIVRVALLPPHPGDKITVEGLEVEEPLKLTGRPVESSVNDHTEYKLGFTTPPLIRPFPATASLSVRSHGRWGDFTQAISVIIWPSWFNQFTWSVSAVFLTMVLPRLGQIVLTENGHIRPTSELLDQLQDSRDFFLISLALTVGIVILFRVLGYTLTFFSRVD